MQDLSFCSKRYWEQPVLVARRWRCEEVRVRLTRRDNPNHLLDVQSVLMTFLHELAHSATPGVFVNQPDVKVIGRGGSIKPQPGKGRKSERRLREEKKTFVFDSHSEVFYSRFARILRAAEKTGLLRCVCLFSFFTPTVVCLFVRRQQERREKVWRGGKERERERE